MKFKISKYDLIRKIEEIDVQISQWDYSIPQFSDIGSITPNQFKYEIDNKINIVAKKYAEEYTKQAFATLLDNIYAEEDFERDLGL